MEHDVALVACVGLDWGDTQHAVQLQRVEGGPVESLDLEQKPDVLHARGWPSSGSGFPRAGSGLRWNSGAAPSSTR